MSNRPAIILMVTCVTVGAAGAYLLSDASAPIVEPRVGTDTFDASRPVAERLAALEQAVADERAARQLLQEEVFYLTSELERLGDDESAARESAPADVAGPQAATVSRAESRRRRNSPEGRVAALVEAGFLPSQAQAITRREQELQMLALQQRF